MRQKRADEERVRVCLSVCLSHSQHVFFITHDMWMMSPPWEFPAVARCTVCCCQLLKSLPAYRFPDPMSVLVSKVKYMYIYDILKVTSKNKHTQEVNTRHETGSSNASLCYCKHSTTSRQILQRKVLPVSLIRDKHTHRHVAQTQVKLLSYSM